MANPDHINILRKGVNTWNLWRKENPKVIPDLSGADLTTNIICDANQERKLNYLIGGTRFYTHYFPEMIDILKSQSKFNLYFFRIKFWLLSISKSGRKKQSLYNSVLGRIEYTTYLRGVNLSHANLDNANFEAVYLPESTLEKASCKNTNFNNADLRQAILNKAHLWDACFSNADLENAQLIDTNPYKANFKGAILRGAILNNISANEADFTGADFGDSSCPSIDFQKRDINTFRSKRTCINKAGLLKACFNNANLRNVEMIGASLWEAEFIGADLSDAQFIGADFKGANFKGANLKGANLENTNVFDVIYNRSGNYRGIRLSGCHGSVRFERFAKDQNYIEELRDGNFIGKILYSAWFIFADCGRTPWLWLFWSILLILSFGSIFANYQLPQLLAWMPASWKEILIDIHPILNNANRTPFTPYYFSIVTFTTLGFGDVTPVNIAGEIWVSIEVIIGYVMLGGLISILATIIARRS